MGKRQEREKDEGGDGMRRKVAVAAAAPVFTMDDLDVLHCAVCWDPLRPPIFQVISPVFDLISVLTTQSLGAPTRR